jgi:hypothetical protein
MTLMAQLKKYSPFAVIIGYLAMYYTGSKGLAGILPDIESISLQRLQDHYQNLIIAGAAVVGIYLLKHIKLPAMIKDIVTIVLWFIAGWQLATAIDPPAGSMANGRVAFVKPSTLNPYAYGQ